MSEPWRLLALPPLPVAVLRHYFAESGDVELVELRSHDRDGLLAALPQADLVLGDWSRVHQLDAGAFAVADRLAFVQQPAVGTDRVDLRAAADRGIPVANVGTANANSVVEWCLAATFSLLRQLREAEAGLRAGEWPQTSLPIRELAGAKVGILGLGGIGRIAADRYAALGCEVSYWSRSVKDVPYAWAEPVELAASSDVLVVLLPGGEGTRHLVGAELLAAMKSDAVLVSAGRGTVLDEDALVEALRAGSLGGAALDVYEHEPLPADSPLRGAERLLLSPHTAGSSREAMVNLMVASRRNLAAAVGGAPVENVVNGVDPAVRRR